MGSQAQYLHTLLAMNQTNKVESQAHAERLRFAEMALEALRNVIKNNPGEITLLFIWTRLFWSFSKQFSYFRFRVRVHRPFQAALLFVTCSRSGQSTAAGIGGRGSCS